MLLGSGLQVIRCGARLAAGLGAGFRRVFYTTGLIVPSAVLGQL